MPRLLRLRPGPWPGVRPRQRAWWSAAASLALAACQPLPHPFANDVPKPGSPMLALRDTAPVAVAPIAGAPRATAEKLAAAMSKALQERDVAASDRVVGLMSYQLDGRLQAMPPSGDKAAIVVLWKLHDPSGKLVGSRAERIVAGAEDWRLGKDDDALGPRPHQFAGRVVQFPQ